MSVDENNDDQRLVIYGLPSSQPSRSVYWCCLIKKLPFKIIDHENWFDKYKPEFLALNPRGMVPTIVDNGFALGEMPAILKYLAVKHKWTDFYPDDLETQGRIDMYLSAHHQVTRMAMFTLMAPFVTNAIEDTLSENAKVSPNNLTGLPSPIIPSKHNPQALEFGRAAVIRLCKLFEPLAFHKKTAFMCGSQTPTIADFAAYEELAQLEWAKLFDFSGFSRIKEWFSEMEKLPFHDIAHEYNFHLGDIQANLNTPERYAKANASCFQKLEQAGAIVETIPA